MASLYILYHLGCKGKKVKIGRRSRKWVVALA